MQTSKPETKVLPGTPQKKAAAPSRMGDRIFSKLTLFFALFILLILAGMLVVLNIEAWPAIQKFGLSFLTSTEWDPVNGEFGALPAIYGSLLLLAFVSASWTAHVISNRQRQASILAAQPIIFAAERFHATTGTYPTSLDELVPNFLPVKPHTRMGLGGTRFVLASRPDGFRLTFALPTDMVCSYDSQTKHWNIHD